MAKEDEIHNGIWIQMSNEAFAGWQFSSSINFLYWILAYNKRDIYSTKLIIYGLLIYKFTWSAIFEEHLEINLVKIKLSMQKW